MTVLDLSEMSRISDQAQQGAIDSYEPFLPAMFNLKNAPYSLQRYRPFAPMFRCKSPGTRVWMTGRQVSKSVSISAKGVLFAAAHPNTCVLYVTPSYEQTRRLSSNYIRRFIETSPMRDVWLKGKASGKSVLQRQVYDSELQFSFAGRDADRIRGFTIDYMFLDEFQDILNEHVPVIAETMSASNYQLIELTGTPKTFSHSIHKQWLQSSQAEWIVPCPACRYDNICSTEYDLDRMIGPWHPDIGPDRPGTICASPRCGRPLDPALGHWEHRYADRRWKKAGYHVPQPILPLHYSSARHWDLLMTKQKNYPVYRFRNEVLGESYDHGFKLITESDVRRACRLPWRNDPRRPDPRILEALPGYRMIALGVDWGGGGEKMTSWTALALCGLRADGGIDVLWGRRLLTPLDHIAEAQAVYEALRDFCPHVLAHDYNGAGTIRETMLIQAGVPEERVMPIVYVPSAKQKPLVAVPPTLLHPRLHYRADRSRVLQLVTHSIKLGLMNFFEWDYDVDAAAIAASADDDGNRFLGESGLLSDFLALMEDKVDTGKGPSIYRIIRQDDMPDDFAQAVTYASSALWYHNEAWPDLVGRVHEITRLTRPQIQRLLGPGAA